MNREKREFRRRIHQVTSLRNLLDEAIQAAYPYVPISTQLRLNTLRRLADDVCNSETGILLPKKD